jgi:hypothetical protein
MGLLHYSGQPTATNAALYTNGTTSAVPIKKIVAVNATGGAATITLTLRRSLSGNTEATTPGAVSVPANSALSLVEDRLLALDEIVVDPGDALWGVASAPATITVYAFE